MSFHDDYFTPFYIRYWALTYLMNPEAIFSSIIFLKFLTAKVDSWTTLIKKPSDNVIE